MTYIAFQHFGQILPHGHALNLSNLPKNEIFKPKNGRIWLNPLEEVLFIITMRWLILHFRQQLWPHVFLLMFLPHGHAQNLPNLPENDVFKPQLCQKWSNLAESFRKYSFHYYEVILMQHFIILSEFCPISMLVQLAWKCYKALLGNLAKVIEFEANFKQIFVMR